MALKPATPIEPYEDLLPELDMLLIMTVEPGFGGQAFLDIMLPKIRRTRELISKHGLELWLQVDGGVSASTIERCAEAGADVFVAGSAVYGAQDPAEAVAKLRTLAENATMRRRVGLRALTRRPDRAGAVRGLRAPTTSGPGACPKWHAPGPSESRGSPEPARCGVDREPFGAFRLRSRPSRPSRPSTPGTRWADRTGSGPSSRIPAGQGGFLCCRTGN